MKNELDKLAADLAKQKRKKADETIPVIAGATSAIPLGTAQNLKKLDLDGSLSSIQRTAAMETVKIINAVL